MFPSPKLLYQPNMRIQPSANEPDQTHDPRQAQKPQLTDNLDMSLFNTQNTEYIQSSYARIHGLNELNDSELFIDSFEESNLPNIDLNQQFSDHLKDNPNPEVRDIQTDPFEVKNKQKALKISEPKNLQKEKEFTSLSLEPEQTMSKSDQVLMQEIIKEKEWFPAENQRRTQENYHLTKEREPKRSIRGNFPTNNLQPHTKTSLRIWLERSEQGRELLKIQEIRELFNHTSTSLPELNLILNHELLRQQWSEMFNSRFLYSRMMLSKTQNQNRITYLKYFKSFELGYKTGVLQDLSKKAGDQLKRLRNRARIQEQNQRNEKRKGEDRVREMRKEATPEPEELKKEGRAEAEKRLGEEKFIKRWLTEDVYLEQCLKAKYSFEESQYSTDCIYSESMVDEHEEKGEAMEEE